MKESRVTRGLNEVDPQLSMWQRGSAEPNRRAIVDPDEKEWTYGEISRSAAQVMRGLREFGIGEGATVALAAPNGREVFEIVAAAMQSGLYCVPINFHLTAGEVAYILENSDSQALFASSDNSAIWSDLAEKSHVMPKHLIAVGPPNGGPLQGCGHHDYETFKQRHRGGVNPPRRAGQRMYYTSGTTGRPKGVQKPLVTKDVDQDAVEYSASLYRSSGTYARPDGVHLVCGPLYHAAPLGYSLAALHLGQTVVVMNKWSAEDTLRLIEKYQVTSTHMVPTMFHRLLQLPPDIREKYDLSSLKSVVHAAAPCPVHTKQQMIAWLGPIIYEYYAASEGGGTSVTPQEWLRKPGTVGRPTSGSIIKILDESNRDVPTGEIGRVFMKLRTDFEYHNDSAKTASGRVRDFFTVGDIGYLDAEGYLFLCDRDSEIIISGGVNVYPAEIEAVLLEHPHVQDVAVIGTPNSEWGEEVKAFVELTDSGASQPDISLILNAHCEQNLARFKCPRTFEFVDKLPRLENGKLYKRRLRDRLACEPQNQPPAKPNVPAIELHIVQSNES